MFLFTLYALYAKYSIARSDSLTDLLTMYLSVIVVDVCPIIPASWTSGTPAFARFVANEILAVWLDTKSHLGPSFVSPAVCVFTFAKTFAL